MSQAKTQRSSLLKGIASGAETRAVMAINRSFTPHGADTAHHASGLGSVRDGLKFTMHAHGSRG